jgi:chromosome segregation ATPase
MNDEELNTEELNAEELTAEQSQADFEAGYSLEEEIKTELAKSEPEETEDAGLEAAQEEVTPTFEETVLAKLEELDKISSRIRNVEGRYGSLNRDFSQLMELQKAREEKPEEAPASISDVVKSGEKVAALQEDWPELQEAIAEAAEAIERRNAVTPDVIEKLQHSSLSAEEVDRKINEARNKARLDAAFPDWEKDINTNEFKSWFVLQSDEMKAKFNSPHVQDAAEVLSGWVESQAPQQQDTAAPSRQRNRLDRALDPTDGKTPAPRAPRLTEQQEFEQGYNSA